MAWTATGSVVHVKLTRLAAIALGCVLTVRTDAVSEEFVTDVNLVTAIDISDSIDPLTADIEVKGIAAALRSPAILEAIRSGPRGRIGFALFAWRSGAYPELVAWTIIASDDDARVASSQLEARFAAFAASDPPAPSSSPHMTDLSGAIDHAAILLLTAPYVADRSVINVIGNGWDNVGEGPHRARDRVLAKGATINGVVLGFDPVLMSYYRSYVIGGPGAFLLSADEPTAMVEVMERKFLYDIALGYQRPRRVAAMRNLP